VAARRLSAEVNPHHARAEGIIECEPTWRSFAPHDLVYRLTWHVAVGGQPSRDIFRDRK
jgi:hypothetical protein